MYFDAILDSNDDKIRIVRFVETMTKFLTTLARAPENVIPTLRYRAPELRASVVNAWDQEIPSAMERLISDVRKTSQLRLSRRGLTGASLEAKLTIIKWWDARIPELGKEALIYLLKCINSFLGSLFSADAIKEAKEMLEHTLDLD